MTETKLIDREKVIAVIKAEHELIYGSLVDGNLACVSPGHCALGALLFAAGVPNDALARLPDSPDDWEMEFTEERRAADLLRDHYGLDLSAASQIVGANDYRIDDDIDARRATVLVRVNELADMQLRALAAPSPRERKEP